MLRGLVSSLGNRGMRTGYAKAVALKNTVSKRILARLFNAMVTPHFLYISLLFDLLAQSEKRQLRTTYFKLAKYQVGKVPWTSSTSLCRKFGIINPTAKCEEIESRARAKTLTHLYFSPLTRLMYDFA